MEAYAVEIVLFESGEFEFRETLNLNDIQNLEFQILEVFIPPTVEDAEKFVENWLVKRGYR
ncbi:hypothetical protein [Thiomicrorhabdus indica]|uniref:hypothetical protein n=1 Tax=Thiomicrorhabdus indica TaxID=2267253 RepID=UPI00102DBC95|nr:hypothetical protein [Thiomicrorhabdus indica]